MRPKFFISCYYPEEEKYMEDFFIKMKWVKWKYEDENSKIIDFAHLKGKYDKIYDHISCNVKSTVLPETKLIIGDKSTLYNMMDKKKRVKYMMEQKDVDKNQNLSEYIALFDSKTTWIIKPVSGHKGDNILITKKYDDFYNHLKNKDDDLKSYTSWGSKKLNIFVMAKYIENPLLIDGKKFHFRVFLVLSSFGKNILLLKNFMYIAKKKYIPRDYNNKSIHNIHSDNADIKPYPEYFEKHFGREVNKKIWGQIKDMSKELCRMTKIKCYRETKNCYNVFGMDIMVDSKYNIKLLECNTNPRTELLLKNQLKNVRDNFYKILHDVIISPNIQGIKKSSNVSKNFILI